MRLVLVVGVLMATQALAQTLPGQQVSRVVLLGAEEGLKSLAMPPPPPSVPLAQLAEDPFASLHRHMLSMQLQHLELHRVSLAGPLTITIIGGSAFVIGGALMLLSLSTGYTAAIIGLVMFIGSALPLIVGIPWLIATVISNNKINQEVLKVRAELKRYGDLSTQRIAPNEGAVLASF